MAAGHEISHERPFHLEDAPGRLRLMSLSFSLHNSTYFCLLPLFLPREVRVFCFFMGFNYRTFSNGGSILFGCPTDTVGFPYYSYPQLQENKKDLQIQIFFTWRRDGDSNPRYGCPHTHFPGVLLQPLGHLSSSGCGDEPPCPCNKTNLPTWPGGPDRALLSGF